MVINQKYIWYDFLALLRTCNVPRIKNYALLKASYIFSLLFRKFKHRGVPYAMSIEPTTACNLSCPQCPSGLKKFSRPTGNARLNDFYTWVERTKKHVIWMNMYFQGEPFIHPDFIQMIQKTCNEKIYTSTSTNGHFLDEERCERIILSGLNRLIISLDGFSQTSYEKYRVGGDFHKVQSGIKTLVETRQRLGKKNPLIILQVIIFKHNQDEMHIARKFAKEVGVDVLKFKTAQIYDAKNADKWLPENENFSRYKRQEKKAEIVKIPNKCWRMWSSSVVTQNGDVVPCCFDKDAAYKIGNLNRSTPKEIWQHELYKDLGGKILSNRKQIEMCKNCSEGVKVWI